MSTMPRLPRVFFSACVGALLMSAAGAQTPQSYPMAQGGEITLPSGDISFADRVVQFDEGNPPSKRSGARVAETILGPTDRPKTDDIAQLEATTLTLGCRGSITLEFTDNALVDIDGPDLHIWEAGDDVEPTELEISRDGSEWVSVGTVSGATASLDIAQHAQPGATYRFVRLTDANCLSRGGNWPGADIDAVAAVGSAERFVFDAGVLFGFDEATLSEEALSLLQDFAEQIQGRQLSQLVIVGHTDALGTDAYNMELSGQRADAVLSVLSAQPELAGLRMSMRPAGEREPIASNDTDEGRQKNRRVEIIVIP